MPQQVRYTDTSLNFLQNFSFIEDETWLNALGLALDGAVSIRLNIPAGIDSGRLALVDLILKSVPTTDPDLK